MGLLHRACRAWSFLESILSFQVCVSFQQFVCLEDHLGCSCFVVSVFSYPVVDVLAVHFYHARCASKVQLARAVAYGATLLLSFEVQLASTELVILYFTYLSLKFITFKLF